MFAVRRSWESAEPCSLATSSVFLALSFLGFVFTVFPLFFIATAAYLFNADWGAKPLLVVFPWEWGHTFGAANTANAVTFFHYVLAWLNIPALLMAAVRDANRFKPKVSLAVSTTIGALVGTDCIFPLLLATREPLSPTDVIKRANSVRAAPASLVPVFLAANLALLYLWRVLDPHTTLFTCAVFAQALVVPVVFGALASARFVHVSDAVSLLFGFVGAACSLFLFSRALHSAASLAEFAALATASWWAAVMCADGLLLSAVAAVYVATHPAHRASPVVRVLCVVLALCVPVGPLGLCVWLAYLEANTDS